MRVRHAEYSIIVQAPTQRGHCQYGLDHIPHQHPCNNDGDFALKVIDDRDRVQLKYGNICSAHLLMRILDWVQGN